ncbi:QcrA and Rieske domain-containing protein [Sediminibacterium soli]|uniref:QcrA and Rieske domain-containing protein n=1 Tax=Sediminibacterium soli TaxID=2698829 RepID=UPI00137AA49B|nr:Rieske 2Fe-2S domain-containing protein [Sediminibacterium soli]NCI46371.1 Rieske 2Fe-2S domain-containing protein [Sediminibacterium soli]
MERRHFIETLSAPVLVACAVCMGACSKSGGGTNTGGTNGGGTGGSASFTVDLGSNLLAVGSSLVQSGVIIVRLAAGNTPASFTAVQVACTHEGTAINYNASQNKFICPNHGSTFSTNGAVTLGPAAANLKSYNISISGNTMTIAG